METYDVVIIGAGPAGSSLGYMLQSNGISVCLIDKATFPRTKLCGGLLTQKTIALYEKIYNDNFSCYTHKTSKVSLYDKYDLLSSVETNTPFCFVDREKFDFLLVKKYIEQRGLLYEGSKITDINLEQRTIKLSNGKSIKYSILVGADGALSSVRSFILPEFKSNAICIDAKLPYSMQKDEIHIYFSLCKQGYAWIFPNNIGIGGPIKKGDNLSKRFDEFASTISNSTVLNKKGAPICFGKYVKKPGQNNVILIGEAAGLVDPLTGEGIYFALLSSKMAFKAISETSGANFENACNIYNKNIRPVHSIIDDALFFKKWFLRSYFLKLIKGRANIVKYVCENILSNYNVSYRKFPFTYYKLRKERLKHGNLR